MPIGSGGMLDYAIQSAATVRQGYEVAARYARLYSDSLELRLHTKAKRASIWLEHRLLELRPAADFIMSAWYTNYIHLPLREDRTVECWLPHPLPYDASEYEQTFEGTKLRFRAPHCGFSFDADYLDAPLATADLRLHAILCAHLDLGADPCLHSKSVRARVRELLATEITRGTYSARDVSRRLYMSQRTLARRLDREGTTFSEELDDLRRELAIRYVSSGTLPMTEIASLLGFSCHSTFHRAFRRWTGRTPLRYRKTFSTAAARGDLRGPKAWRTDRGI